MHAVGGGPMQVARTNSRNSSVFSCGVIAPSLHSSGNVALDIPPPDTWKSLYSTRPQRFVGFGDGEYAIGVSNVYCTGAATGDVVESQRCAGVPAAVAGVE